MAVEKDMWGPFTNVAHDHRVAGRRTRLGIYTKCGQISHEPVRRLLASLLVVRVGRDRGNSQQIGQTVDRGVEVLIDAVQNVGVLHFGGLTFVFGRR